MRMIIAMIFSFLSADSCWAETPVTILATPDGGIQPQAVTDSAGTIHLIYFKGDASQGNLFYVRKGRDAEAFSQPLQVNSTPNSAVAVGSVRGGQLAIGKGNRVHVVWFGSNQIKDKNGTPLCYARLNDAGASFETQRNLIGDTRILDGGGSVAADGNGNVCIVWHALKKGDPPGEKNRQLWIARSANEGKTFAPEEPVWNAPTGACACCATKVLMDQAGNITAIYRSASNNGSNREVFVIASTDQGKSFEKVMSHPWKVSTCPMSTFSLIQGPKGVVAAWETKGKVFWSALNPGHGSSPLAAPEGANQKHPALAIHSTGEMILVWTEGTGWQKGGDLVWQVYDREGNPTRTKGRLEGGIPVWGLPTAVATEKGFTIFH